MSNNDNGSEEPQPLKVPIQPQINHQSQNIYYLSTVLGIVSILTVAFIGADECRKCFIQLDKIKESVPIISITEVKKIWAYGTNIETGYLKEVFTVLDRLGYQNSSNDTEWDLLWAHDYPFRTLFPHLHTLKSHQKVNHFPGCGYITNKVDLATSGLKYIPPAFKLPTDKDRLLEFSEKHPSTLFVQKNNDHRNIKITNIGTINLNKEGTFIQEYVDKPLLINGHKFDIGIYTVITSINPLRAYIYNGEALLRFCPEKYYPFDSENLNKYVVGDDYLPIWEVPAFDTYYNKLGYSMKESLNAYLRKHDQQPTVIWDQIEDAIRTVLLAKEPLITDVLKRFKTKRNFFELMRFDFVIDENLKIYLLEANMSPNLSSAHFRPNRLLYQQVLYNIFGLVGIGEMIQRSSLKSRSTFEEDMITSDKNIATFPEICSSHICMATCSSIECQLCKQCLSPDTKDSLIQAYREHVNKRDCKRIFPPSIKVEDEDIDGISTSNYSLENQLQYRWFLGKCLIDSSWC